MKDKFILTTCILLLSLIAAAQNEGKDPLTLSIVEEPVTLQKGRIQGNLGYLFDYYTKYYNANGQKSNIIDRGLVSSMNQFNYYSFYGLTDRIQIGFQQVYCSGNEGYETIIKQYPDERYYYTSIKETNGFSDILINMGYKLPGISQKIEVAIFPGIFIPMSHESKEPIHDIRTDTLDLDKVSVNYTSFEKVGTGAFRFELAGKVKFRINNKMALQLFGKYNLPLSSAKYVYWESIYDGEKYNHIKNNCHYSPSRELFGNIEYQIVPDKKEIMGLTLGMNVVTNFNEWIKIKEEKTYLPNTFLCRIYTGLELIVTEHIRFQQQFSYDNAGKNTKGAFGLMSSFTFNFMKQ